MQQCYIHQTTSKDLYIVHTMPWMLSCQWRTYTHVALHHHATIYKYIVVETLKREDFLHERVKSSISWWIKNFSGLQHLRLVLSYCSVCWIPLTKVSEKTFIHKPTNHHIHARFLPFKSLLLYCYIFVVHNNLQHWTSREVGGTCWKAIPGMVIDQVTTDHSSGHPWENAS